MNDNSLSWRMPPEDLVLDRGEVHIWRASLDRPEEVINQLELTLSSDERKRAERLRAERVRLRFVAGRGMLRMLLGSYLCVAPNKLGFSYGMHGKPFLAQPSGAERLCFNLSHSEDMVIFVLTEGREVGIDLEHVHPVAETDVITGQCFSARERDELNNLTSNQRETGFFNCWTRKEAYLKARGGGFSVSLDGFSVSLTPGEPAALLEDLDDLQKTDSWQLHHLIPESGYIAALAVEGTHAVQLSYWLMNGVYPKSGSY